MILTSVMDVVVRFTLYHNTQRSGQVSFSRYLPGSRSVSVNRLLLFGVVVTIRRF